MAFLGENSHVFYMEYLTLVDVEAVRRISNTEKPVEICKSTVCPRELIKQMGSSLPGANVLFARWYLNVGENVPYVVFYGPISLSKIR